MLSNSLKYGLVNNSESEFDRALTVMDAYGGYCFALLLSKEELSILKSWNNGWVEDNFSYKGHRVILKEDNNVKQ